MDCVPATQLPPGDPRLVEAIVGQLKSKGIFDQFRKECLADVDTKPAFQNLRQRVEGQVNKFLEKRTWKNDINKNQLRDGVRKHVNSLGILETGIDAIITQVVNPKIKPLILPYVEDTVYAFLQIDKPKRERKMSEPLINLMHQVKAEEDGEEEEVEVEEEEEEEEEGEVEEEEQEQEPELEFEFELKEEEEKPKPKHVEPVEEKKTILLPMETDVISSEEDDILARESPEALSKSSASPDVEDVKSLDEDAQDGFDGCPPVKEDSPDGIAAEVERLQLSEEESKPVQAPKQPLTLFEDQSLDSISSNSSGLTFSPLTVKGSPDSKKDEGIRSDGSPGVEMRSTTSTPLVDEKPVDDTSQSSLGSNHSKDFPSPEKIYPGDGTMHGRETSASSLAALQSGARPGKDGTSLMSFDEESLESKASSKVSVVSGKSEVEEKTKLDKSEGEITSSSSDLSDGDTKGKQERLPSEGRHFSDLESSHKSSRSKSDHKKRRDSHSRDSHSRDSHSRDRDREKDKERDSRHQKDKERKHSKSRDDHHSHRDKDRKHHRRDKDHDGDRERSRGHHHPSSGSSYKESSSSKDKDRSSHHSGGKSSEGKSRSSHSNEKSDGKTEAKSNDKSQVKSSKSSVKKERRSEEKSDKKSGKTDKKREQHNDEKHGRKLEHKLEKNTDTCRENEEKSNKSGNASKNLKLDQKDKESPEILSINSSSENQENGVLGILGENSGIDAHMLGLNGDNIIVEDDEGNFMMLTYEDDTEDSMSSSNSQIGGSVDEELTLKTQLAAIRKEDINEFEGFENAKSDSRLLHYIRNIVKVPDEMDMEYSEWFDESDRHMTLYDEAWKEKVPIDDFLKCMHRLGAIIRNEKGAIEDHSTHEPVSFVEDIKDNNNIQPVGKKRRISNSSTASSSGSSTGSPKHKRFRRGRSTLSDTSQMLEQDSVIVRGYALLTPEDDGNRSMSREYDIDYSQKIANYSPLSPASDSSADEAKAKNRGTVMNSRDNLVKPSVKMDQKNGHIVAQQRS